MIISGKIVDKNGVLLTDVQITTGNMDTGQLFYPYENFPVGEYQIELLQNQVTHDEGIFVKKNGYVTMAVSFKNLTYENDIVMMTNNQINNSGGGLLSSKNFPLLLVGVGAAYVLSKKDDKVGKIESSDVKTGALIIGGLVGWSLLKQLLEGLGIWKDADQVNLDNASNNPNSWWNPNFFTTKPANVNYTQPVVTVQQGEVYAKRIYDAFGPFNDNEETVIAVFKSLPSRSAGSFVSYIFQHMYKMDLLTFLRGGSWPQDRLSDADVNLINSYVNNLPKY